MSEKHVILGQAKVGFWAAAFSIFYRARRNEGLCIPTIFGLNAVSSAYERVENIFRRQLVLGCYS